MDLNALRAALRLDGVGWRRFAELGCVYGPEWWKRSSPPVIAAIIFAIAQGQRAAVLRNQRQVRGARGWLRERWDAYRVFAEGARSMAESLEQWGPSPPSLTLHIPHAEVIRAALAEGRGLVVPTGHFGGWEVAARFLSDFGRPANLVTAHELNPTARDFMHRLRTRHGVNVIYSDGSVFAGLSVLQALRRNEVIGMQIDPWGQSRDAPGIEFCGRPAPFHLGPFVLARVARAPLIPAFAVRTGIRRYEMRTPGRFDPRTAADSGAAFTATVRAFEHLVRECPAQWLMFEDVWPDAAARTESPPSARPTAAGSARPGAVAVDAHALMRRQD